MTLKSALVAQNQPELSIVILFIRVDETENDVVSVLANKHQNNLTPSFTIFYSYNINTNT